MRTNNLLSVLRAACLFVFILSSAEAQDFWQPTNGPYGGSVTSFAFKASGQVFAATWDGGVFRSTDNGDNWSHTGWTTFGLNTLATNASGHIFAGTAFTGWEYLQGSVYRSTDNGENWVEVNTGMGYPPVYSFAINSSGHIFTGTDSGVFRSINNGENWTQINTGLTNPYVNSLAINFGGHIFAGM